MDARISEAVAEARDAVPMREAAEHPETDAMAAGTEDAREIAEQREMDAVADRTETAQEAAEQREMDEALETPDTDEQERLGEYRIFCDTRPAGSRYRIFGRT